MITLTKNCIDQEIAEAMAVCPMGSSSGHGKCNVCTEIAKLVARRVLEERVACLDAIIVGAQDARIAQYEPEQIPGFMVDCLHARSV